MTEKHVPTQKRIMHTLTEPVKHPRLSNFSLKPKLLRSYFFHSDSASADKKEIFRNSS